MSSTKNNSLLLIKSVLPIITISQSSIVSSGLSPRIFNHLLHRDFHFFYLELPVIGEKDPKIRFLSLYGQSENRSRFTIYIFNSRPREILALDECCKLPPREISYGAPGGLVLLR